MKRIVLILLAFVCLYSHGQVAMMGGGVTSSRTYNDVVSDDSVKCWLIAQSSQITTDVGVTTWADSSDWGNDVSIVLNDYEPSFAGDSITFDGVDDHLAASFTINQPTTIYAVMKLHTYASEKYLLTGMSANVLLLTDGTDPGLYITAGTSSSTNSTLTTGDWGVFTIVLDGANSSFQINNETAVTGNFGSNDLSGLSIGTFEGGTYGNAHMSIKEILLTGKNNSSADRELMKSYLNNKYSVY